MPSSVLKILSRRQHVCALLHIETFAYTSYQGSISPAQDVAQKATLAFASLRFLFPPITTTSLQQGGWHFAPVPVFNQRRKPKKSPQTRASLNNRSLRFAAGLLALVLFQEALAQANRFRGDLDQLVVGDEFHRVFQRHLHGRHQTHGFVGAGGTHVGQLLALDGVDDQVVVARVDADDHAFVHRVVVDDEHAAAVLQFPDRVGDSGAVILRDQHAVTTASHFATGIVDRCVFVEHVAHQAGAAGQGHEFTLEADQATRRDQVLETHAALAIRFHVLQVATTTAQFFHHAALVGFFYVNRQVFKRLVTHAIHHFEHHAWTRHSQLEAFATHVFDQNRQVQLAAARYFKDRVVVGR